LGASENDERNETNPTLAAPETLDTVGGDLEKEKLLTPTPAKRQTAGEKSPPKLTGKKKGKGGGRGQRRRGLSLPFSGKLHEDAKTKGK